jgi:hypothetical protein
MLQDKALLVLVGLRQDEMYEPEHLEDHFLNSTIVFWGRGCMTEELNLLRQVKSSRTKHGHTSHDR